MEVVDSLSTWTTKVTYSCNAGDLPLAMLKMMSKKSPQTDLFPSYQAFPSKAWDQIRVISKLIPEHPALQMVNSRPI